MRKIAREMGVSRELVRHISKNEHGLKPYKLQKGQFLTTMSPASTPRRRYVLGQNHFLRWEVIQCETIDQPSKWQDLVRTGSWHIFRRRTPSSSPICFGLGGICASGKTPLVLLDQRVKINKEVYRRHILGAVVLPWAHEHFADEKWTFQQDSAQAHRAKMTLQCVVCFRG